MLDTGNLAAKDATTSMTGQDTSWVDKAVGGKPLGRPLALASLAEPSMLAKGGFAVTSPAFRHGDELDPSFTACEEDAVAPPLEWTAPPPGAHEIVLIAEEAETGRLHWAAWGWPGQRGKLLEGEAPPRIGKNAAGNSEWLLPDPPLGEERRYVFQLFALDLPMALMPGASLAQLTDSMRGHVVAAALITARFEGHEVEAWDDEDFEDED